MSETDARERPDEARVVLPYPMDPGATVAALVAQGWRDVRVGIEFSTQTRIVIAKDRR